MSQSNDAMLDLHLNYKDMVSTVTGFRYIGDVADLSKVTGSEGDVCVCIHTMHTYVWVDNYGWEDIDSPSNNDQTAEVHDIKVSTCPHCAAALPLTRLDDNGICTCEYCGSPVYVW